MHHLTPRYLTDKGSLHSFTPLVDVTDAPLPHSLSRFNKVKRHNLAIEVEGNCFELTCLCSFRP